MIDSYEILVPSFVESGTAFEVRIIARDVGGNIVDDDSTVVTLSASSADIQFDSDGDGNFGEVGDDQDTLLNGIVELFSLDTKGTTFTLTANATGGITGNTVVSYNFNCITFTSLNVETPELSTQEHQRFIRGFGGTLTQIGAPAPTPIDITTTTLLTLEGVS